MIDSAVAAPIIAALKHRLIKEFGEAMERDRSYVRLGEPCTTVLLVKTEEIHVDGSEEFKYALLNAVRSVGRAIKFERENIEMHVSTTEDFIKPINYEQHMLIELVDGVALLVDRREHCYLVAAQLVACAEISSLEALKTVAPPAIPVETVAI